MNRPHLLAPLQNPMVSLAKMAAEHPHYGSLVAILVRETIGFAERGGDSTAERDAIGQPSAAQLGY